MIVDLTLPVSGRLPTFPGSPPPQFLNWSSLERDGYNLELLFLSTHSGTHIDAPFHFARNGRTVDRIPLRRLVSEDAVLARIPKARGGTVSKQDILSYEGEHGAIPDGGTVIFYTGWQKNISKGNYFTQNPGLSGDAARYLISKRINLVGTDSPSIDPGWDQSFAVHRMLAKNDVLIVENLANLDRIPGSQFSFAALPLKLRNASGSPVRAVASYSNTRSRLGL